MEQELLPQLNEHFRSAKLNIVILGNFFYPNGMAPTKHMQHFIDVFNKYEHRVRLLLLRQSGATIPLGRKDGFFKGTEYRTIGSDIHFNIIMFFKLCLYLWQGWRLLFKWTDRTRRNILYVYGAPEIENILFLAWARVLGYRIVFYIVEDNRLYDEPLHFWARLKWKMSLHLDKMTGLLAQAVTVVSTHLERKYRGTEYKINEIKIIPIAASVDCNQPRARFHDPVRIVYSGTYGKKDGVDDLVEAFCRLKKVCNNCELLLAGSGANLSGFRERYRGIDGLSFIGYLEDRQFYAFLRDADILCMTRENSPYANAGFPFKLGEYLATGNPVLASAVGDVALYLEHLKEAYLFEPGNSEQLFAGLEYLVTRPDEARKMGLGGKEACRKHFDPDIVGRKLIELFYNV